MDDETHDWRQEATCRQSSGYDPEMWFAYPSEPEKYDTAMALCRSCPVRVACFDDAMEREGMASLQYRHGIRGAASPERRLKIALSRRRAERRAAR